MRSMAMKFIAILFAALFLLGAVAAVVGMIFVAEMEMQETNPEEHYLQNLRGEALMIAYAEVRNYQTWKYSTAPEDAVEQAIVTGRVDVSRPTLTAGVQAIGWIITDAADYARLEGDLTAGEGRYLFTFETVEPSYRVVHKANTPENNLDDLTSQFYYAGQQYSVFRCQGEPFRVEVMLEVQQVHVAWQVLTLIYAQRELLPLILIGCLLLFGMCMIYLCWVAGKKKGVAEPKPGGLNALPLDLYTVMVGLAGIGGVYLVIYLAEILAYQDFSWMILWLIAILSLLVCLLPVMYIFAIAAQVKAGNRFWLRRSLIGAVLILLFRGIRWCFRGACGVVRMIPIIWRWLLTALLMPLVPLLLLILANQFYYNFAQGVFVLLFLGSLALDVVLVLYGGWCFGKILQGAKRMSAGDLQTKIDTRYLYGDFRDCAEQLNKLSDAAMIAAREQMKSERMKTELITNVSHDIKTPLTSIINYVDFLQKPHTEEEAEQYLEVLSRQSARLKKLVEDLMEMSKATTGNVQVEVTRVDACEAVHQALGEFADKLAAMQVTPVFQKPEEQVSMQADGRLTWRVMSNLLGNVVKYAMPGTRLYVDVAKVEKNVMISFKNISAEPLNITADELMERFVRGDASRNTEGSGLGLNIAKGLMEVQGGSLQVLVDGDLFKVTLLFLCS